VLGAVKESSRGTDWGSKEQPEEEGLQLRIQFHILCHSSRALACHGAWLFKLGVGGQESRKSTLGISELPYLVLGDGWIS